jgi:S-formylglutathione hydrolase FrmB
MNDDGQISRRALVLGGGALAVLAACKSKTKSPDVQVPPVGAPVKRLTLQSATMQGPVRYGLSAPAEPRAVLVCLHPRGDFGYRTVFDGLHIHHVVGAAHKPIAVVAADGGPDSYWHKRKSGIDPQAMLHDELLPHIDAVLGVQLPRAIMGWSMGGYGALLAAERHPDLYKAVVGSSPALFPNANATSPGAFDDAADYQRNDVFAHEAALAPLVTRIDCGTQDPFLPTAKAFAARLPNPNRGGFTPGNHDAPYWRSVAPAQIDTIATALGL